MKHAYLLLVHTEFEVLQCLLRTLDDERNDVFIHFDRKVKTLPEVRMEHAGLYVLDERTDVRWGDLSVVEAEYRLYEAATANGHYGYYHMLSGVDLPLKTQDEIHRFFDEHQGQEFIGYTLTTITPEVVRKAQRWHLFPRSFRNEHGLKRIVRAVFIRVQEAFGIRRNKEVAFKKGSQWCSLTDEAVRLVLERKAWAMKTFSHTFCADEMFVHTIVWNSPLHDRIFCTTDDGHGCMRAIGWQNGQLIDWAQKDYEWLKQSEAMFARKFNSKDMPFIRQIAALSDNDRTSPCHADE